MSTRGNWSLLRNMWEPHHMDWLIWRHKRALKRLRAADRKERRADARIEALVAEARNEYRALTGRDMDADVKARRKETP